jgi:hypothetical protein
MKPLSVVVGSTLLSVVLGAAPPAQAQTPPQKPAQDTHIAKMNAYVGCINRLSARSYDSRKRYFSWVGKKGPTGKERIIYGTYTIYDTSDCRKKVEQANALAPRDATIEAAASAYAQAVSALEPLLKEADDYYQQENYKDDKMAKGKALHPRLVAAWDAFAKADQALRHEVEAINDRRAAEKLAEIEKSEGRQARYHVQAVMIHAKRVLRAQNVDKPDMKEIAAALTEYEATVNATDRFAGNNAPAGTAKIGSFFMNAAKSYLVSAKQLMRRLRDKTPYSAGDRMMLNAGSGWMVEGSPPRLLRDYNQLVDAFNRGASI